MRDDLERAVQERYAIEYDNRFNNCAEEEKKRCECGRYIDLDENVCEVCKRNLKKRFSEMLHSNFTDEEIKEINEMYDGEEIA